MIFSHLAYNWDVVNKLRNTYIGQHKFHVLLLLRTKHNYCFAVGLFI